MDDNADPKVRTLKPVPYVRTPETARPAESEPLWPSLNDPYTAAGTPDSEAIPRLVVVMGRDRFKPGGGTVYYALPYSDMGVGEFGFDADGQWFWFPFNEPGRRLILKAHGRGILRAGDYISLRRMPWIRLADRDFRSGDVAGGDEPIFTRIEVEEEEEEQEK
jgi:hypothetical protein